MSIPKIPKTVKIAVGAVVALIILALLGCAVVALDLPSHLATGTEQMTPEFIVNGHALVVYDPGVTGAAKDAATKIAGDLEADGYDVTLAGVSSGAAANTSGYDVIVAGGPVYAGKVGSSIYSFLDDIKAPGGVKVGAFADGRYPANDRVEDVFPAGTPLKATLLLFPDNDTDRDCAGFVAGLLQ